MEQIIIFRPFIRDLCKQLQTLHEQNQSDTPLTVFRGHADMTVKQFTTIERNVGSLISFNGFLSTTKDFDVALVYAGVSSAQKRSVVFEIRTNYKSTNVVFADVAAYSEIPEEEVLFSLCSVFKINNIQNDEQNELSKVILSTPNEDPVAIPEQRNYRLPFLYQYCRKTYLIGICAVILFTMIITLGALFGVILKFQNHNGRPYDCVGANCADVSTTSASTLGADCIPVGWNYKGDLITTDQPYVHLTVDHDSNVYVAHEKMKSLDKWSPQGTFLRQLYQCQFWNRSLNIFKIIDDNNGSLVSVEYDFNRILKYSNGSELGETIITGTLLRMFSHTKAVDIDAYTIAVDQTGYVILGELHRVSIWSPDGKFHSTIMNKHRIHESVG
ncbi:unnamed protein product [Adineta ricciae]|uniref:Uncharacterized protein n=1 Tax=Adineta ricciae TaxID=249248 RepID=A0A814X0Q7_ADIRI|nr:unnamed protein product [Adineta ricciae]